MADGISHRKYLNLGWVFAIPISNWFAGLMQLQGYSYWFSFFFCIWNYWLCRFIDPDLDLISASGAESSGMKLLRRVPIVGWLLVAMWLSYSTFYGAIIYSLGGHRSVASHGLIIGTIGRMIFFNIPMWGFIYWERVRNGRLWSFQEVYADWNMKSLLIPYYLSQLLMWNLGDLIHLILDLQITKGILYKPQTTKNREGLINFKPQYGKFITMILRVLLGYIYNGIKNFRKR